MSTTVIWGMIVLVGVGTFLMRVSGIQLFGTRGIPPRLKRALRFVPSAVIAAIVVPAIVYGGPNPGLHLENTRLLAGLLAAITAWTSRSVLATLGVGMGSLWLLEWLAFPWTATP